MRTLSSEALAKIQTQHGTEPVFILEVAWSQNADVRIAYSDQKINDADYPYPKILSISDFETSLKITGESDVQTISVVMDDVDGQIKGIMDSQDIYKRPCWLYQTFKGLSGNQKFLVFKGEITSPISWNEGDRTVSFSIATSQESNEVAFSMEDGDFPNIPSDALGRVWPLVFGTVCNMEGVQVRSPRKGYLAAGEGIADFTLIPRICQARLISCPDVPTGTLQTNVNAGNLPDPNLAYPQPSVNTNIKDTIWDTNTNAGFTTATVNTTGPDQTCLNNRFDAICGLISQLEQQKAYEHPSFVIRGGNKFPQNQPVTMNIGGAKFTGSFSGETFTVTGREHPEFAKTPPDDLVCHDVDDRSFALTRTAWTNGWYYDPNSATWKYDKTADEEDCDTVGGLHQVADGGPTASQKAFDDMATSNFCWLPAGTEVFLESEAEVLFIVSLIPGTINNVAAYKRQTTTGRSLLMTVPTDLYKVYETDYNAYTVVEIGFDEPLNQIDETWSNEIYISFTSDIGPNPCDIIEWLVEKYTDLTVDAASFAEVKAYLTNYPANFYLKTKQSVFQTIQDIAYQARCAVYTRDNTLLIKYLAKEPASVRTLTKSDILTNSFLIKYTESMDLGTKQSVTWQPAEVPVIGGAAAEQLLVLKHNVSKYGIVQNDHNYYTQNTFDTILKSATFWLVRAANTWKLVEFDTPLEMLDLDVFDCITLDMTQLSPDPVKVIITKIQYNNQDNKVHFECLTPIRSGETQPYQFFWPADIDPHIIFPTTNEEINAGSGYTFTVTPPIGHILLGGDTTQQDERRIILSAGDRYPSDIGDTFPVVHCDISDVVDVVEPDPVFEAWKRASSANQQNLDNQLNKDATGGGSSKKDKDKKPTKSTCGVEECTPRKARPGYGIFDEVVCECIYAVYVDYVIPRIVTSGKAGSSCAAGPCWCKSLGNPCDGPTYSICQTFVGQSAAWQYMRGMQEEIKALQCQYHCGADAPYLVHDPKKISGGECNETGQLPYATPTGPTSQTAPPSKT